MPASKEKKKEMVNRAEETIELLEKLIRVNKDIINGVPECIACEKEKIPLMKYRNSFHNLNKWYSDCDTEATFGRFKETESWEEKFIKEYFGKYNPVLQDFEEAYEIVTTNALSEKQKALIDFYYKEGMTLEETGKEFGVTRERVRQIKARSLRKMRAKKYVLYFEKGIEYARANEEKARLEATRNDAKLEIEGQITTLKKQNIDYSSIRDALNSITLNETEELVKNIFESTEREVIPVESLPISKRARNVLKRKGIFTLNELSKYTVGEVSRIRNMGVVSFNEICDQMNKYGIRFADESKELERTGAL